MSAADHTAPEPREAADGEAERALAEGDFGRARALARADLSEREEHRRRRARALLERLRPDPLVALLLLGALVFFAISVLATAHR